MRHHQSGILELPRVQVASAWETAVTHAGMGGGGRSLSKTRVHKFFFFANCDKHFNARKFASTFGELARATAVAAPVARNFVHIRCWAKGVGSNIAGHSPGGPWSRGMCLVGGGCLHVVDGDVWAGSTGCPVEPSS